MARRTVTVSARTGRFVSTRAAARNPRGTVTLTVGSKASGYRNAGNGRFTSRRAAARNPGGTIKE